MHQQCDQSHTWLLCYILRRWNYLTIQQHGSVCTLWRSFSQWKQKTQQSRGSHFLSKNDAMPWWKVSVLTLAQIIRFLMSSASKAGLGAIFTTAQEMVAMRKALEEMKCTQIKPPIQTVNSAAAGVVNNTIVTRKLKTMDRRLHCLRCIEAQGQFRYYWASGNLNWGDYSTKRHPPPFYHKSKRIKFALAQ